MANTDMTDALLYTIPKVKVNDFLKFVKEGEKRADGTFEETAQGDKVAGIIAWLKTRPGKHAIYTAVLPEDGSDTAGSLVFVTTTSDSEGDWSKIPRLNMNLPPNTRVKLNPELNALLTAQP